MKASVSAAALRLLRYREPARWRRIILDAMCRAEGHVRDYAGWAGAATILGISRDTLFRWLRDDSVLRKAPRAAIGRPGGPRNDA